MNVPKFMSVALSMSLSSSRLMHVRLLSSVSEIKDASFLLCILRAIIPVQRQVDVVRYLFRSPASSPIAHVLTFAIETQTGP